ncbi:hypothetical protein GCM10009038_14400 [Salinicola rhizosphaerae]|uniref:Uncharacterized protein n=1 Tax=Salinicola rhizosphaerae TaxID=1443141 RepID=A0ABQ3DVE7_9GAMM|nr:hypothetical protein GCM10009038_14400 [Salinicola rhizosphaerae]
MTQIVILGGGPNVGLQFQIEFKPLAHEPLPVVDTDHRLHGQGFDHYQIHCYLIHAGVLLCKRERTNVVRQGR